MRFTDEEQRYFECLASGMRFEQMARKLGWTYREVIDFGDRFFGREFEERSKTDPLYSMLHEECRRYRLLLMRACQMPGAEELVKRYENATHDLHRRPGPRGDPEVAVGIDLRGERLVAACRETAAGERVVVRAARVAVAVVAGKAALRPGTSNASRSVCPSSK